MADQTIALTFSEGMELSFLDLMSDKISKDTSNVRLQSIQPSITVPEVETVSVNEDVDPTPSAQNLQKAADPISEQDLQFSSDSEPLKALTAASRTAAFPQMGSAEGALPTPAGPEIESITGYDLENPDSVTVNVTLAEPGVFAMTYYSVNGSPWTDFMGSFILTENCQFMVKAEDMDGNQTWSEVLNVTKIGMSDENAPTIDSITGYDLPSPDHVMVDVSVTDTQSGVANTYYSFNGSSWIEFTDSFILSENGPFRIKAVDNAGNETRSQVLYVKNIDPSYDPIPPVINSFSGYAATIVVAETVVNRVYFQVDAYDDSGSISQYVLSYDDQTEQVYPDMVGDFHKDFSCDVFGLKDFCITVYDEAGNSADAYTVVDLPDAMPPEFLNYVGNAAFDLNGNGTLFWSAATDNSGEIFKYDIQIYDAFDNPMILLESTVNSVDVSGLPAGTYSYEVVAYDAAGNTAVSPRTGFSVRNMIPTQEGGIVQVYENVNPIVTQITPLYNYDLSGNIHHLYVFSAGKAVGTTVQNGAQAHAISGGALEMTYVTAGGYLFADGGNVLNTEVGDGGIMVVSDGIADTNYVNGAGAQIEISDTGIMNGTILRGGNMVVKNGGQAIDTNVKSSSLLYVSSGGTAHMVEVSSGGILGVDSSGGCCDVFVLDGGVIHVSTGAHITGLALESGYTMRMEIDSDSNIDFFLLGTEYSIVNGKLAGLISDGNFYLAISAGASISNFDFSGVNSLTSEHYVGGVEIYSGAVGYDAVNHDYGQINVYSGGYLSRAVTDSEAEIYIYGGSADNIEINSSGYLWIHSGGRVNNIQVGENGGLIISSGALANHINMRGNVIVEESNAYVSNVNVYESGRLEICGAHVNDVTVHSGGMLVFSSSFYPMDVDIPVMALSGIASNVTISSGGFLVACYTGIASQVKAYSGAQVHVSSASEISNLEINNGANAYVWEKGRLVNPIVSSGGRVDIDQGGSATGMEIHSGAIVNLSFYSGMTLQGNYEGHAFNTIGSVLSGYTFGENCLLTLNPETLAQNLTVGSGGFAHIVDGASVQGMVVESTGSNAVFGAVEDLTNYGDTNFLAGATGSRVTARSYFTQIHSGAVVNSMNLIDEGKFIIHSGGTASNITMSGANCTGVVFDGGVVNGLALTDTVMNANSGSLLKGEINLSNSVIYAEAGAMVEFSLAGRTSTSGYLINDLSRIVLNTPDYSITVSASQNFGIYKLASGAGTFSDPISIYEGSNYLGDLWVNGSSLSGEHRTYLLQKTDNNLHLSVTGSEMAPLEAVSPIEMVRIDDFFNGIRDLRQDNASIPESVLPVPNGIQLDAGADQSFAGVVDQLHEFISLVDGKTEFDVAASCLAGNDSRSVVTSGILSV